MSKKSTFRGPIDKQHRTPAQGLSKSASQHLYHIHWSVPSKFNGKKSVLLTRQIFGLHVKTLAVVDKYFVLNRDNLTIPIQMQLCKKEKALSEFFASFLKSTWNFEFFKK